ncbi:MAG: hypothetical protein U1E51_06855 [Candidatus Binatia bacterium]|nr:hypothetical protein [Candidatus Binatia bacterium]
MRWALREGTHGILDLVGDDRFSAVIERANLTAHGEPIWCFYAERTVNGVVLRAPAAFAKFDDARAWVEDAIVPEMQLTEIGELA